MSTFSLILGITILFFGNMFYIIAKPASEIECIDSSDDQCQEQPFTGSNIGLAFIYAFRTGLGDFQTDYNNE